MEANVSKDGFVRIKKTIIKKVANNKKKTDTPIGKFFEEAAIEKLGLMTDRLNYGSMVNPKSLYPVIYTITQSMQKIFKPQMVLGADLTETQIKYLYQCGYFENNSSIKK